MINRVRLRMPRFLAGLAMLALLASCVGVPERPFRAAESKAALEAAMRTGDMDESLDLISSNDDVLSDAVALDLAVRAGLVGPARFFSARTDVNGALDADGTTALIRAVQSAPRAALDDLAAVLLQAGADPLRRDNFGRHAIDYAGFEGDLALVRYLQTGGRTAYRSDRPVHIAWLPAQDWRNIELEGPPAGFRTSRVLRSSPLRAASAGRPETLFGSAWVPRSGPTDVGPFTGLRFHVDGTGEVMSFYPRERRMEPAESAALAWRYERDQLSFTVVSPEFAAYCQSAVGGPGRFGVSCQDYAALDPESVGETSTASDVLARALLDDEDRRQALTAVGTTQAVLESSAAGLCTPERAPASLRAGLAPSAASAVEPGGWVVFDAGRFRAFGPGGASVCTQQQSRSAAFRECGKAGGRCRSVGGCAPGQAAALASVDGHGWGSLGCGPDVETAKKAALQACRAAAACDCQVLYVSKDGGFREPAAGCRPRR